MCVCLNSFFGIGKKGKRVLPFLPQFDGDRPTPVSCLLVCVCSFFKGGMTIESRPRGRRRRQNCPLSLLTPGDFFACAFFPPEVPEWSVHEVQVAPFFVGGLREDRCPPRRGPLFPSFPPLFNTAETTLGENDAMDERRRRRRGPPSSPTPISRQPATTNERRG